MIKINKYMAVIALFYTGVSLATKPSGDLVVSTTSLGKVARRIGRRGPSHLKLLQDVKSLKAIVQQFSEVPLKSLQGKRDLKLNLDSTFGIPSHTLADYIESVRALTTKFQSLPQVIKLEILELCQNVESRLSESLESLESERELGGMSKLTRSEKELVKKNEKELSEALLRYFLANSSVIDFLNYFFEPREKRHLDNKFYSYFIKIFIDNDMLPEHFANINGFMSKDESVVNFLHVRNYDDSLADRLADIRSAFGRLIGDDDYLNMRDLNALEHHGVEFLKELSNDEFSFSFGDEEDLIITDTKTKRYIGHLSKENREFLKIFFIKTQPLKWDEDAD